MATKRHILQRLQFAQLCSRIADQLKHFHPQLRKTLLDNLGELIAAVVMARSVQLARIGEELPVDSTEAGREQWVRRQLSNDTEDTLHLCRPVAESLLAGFAGRTVRLILDPTDLADDLTIVTIGLAYQGRALPLAWATVYIKPDTVKDAIRLLFAELKQWLPQDAHVYLLADREFHGEETLQLIQEQGWIPVVRTVGNLRIELADGRQCDVKDLAPAPGPTAFYQPAIPNMTNWAKGGSVNVKPDWRAGHDEDTILGATSGDSGRNLPGPARPTHWQESPVYHQRCDLGRLRGLLHPNALILSPSTRHATPERVQQCPESLRRRTYSQ